MDPRKMYLILEDSSSYESGCVANLVDITGDIDNYLAMRLRWFQGGVTKSNWHGLNDLLEEHVVRAQDVVGSNGDILLATRLSPNFAMYLGGAKFCEAIKELTKGGSDHIMDEAKQEDRELVDKTIKEWLKGTEWES